MSTAVGAEEAQPQAGKDVPPALVARVTGTGRGMALVWPALMAIVIALAFGVQDQFWQQTVVNAEIMSIAALGLYVTFGLSGQVSLGNAGFYAVGGYTAGLLAAKQQVPFLLAIIAAVAVAALVGLALGVPALRLRGHYLALVTLGFGQVVSLLLLNWTSLTGGSTGVLNIITPLIGGVELVSVTSWAVFVGVVAVLAAFVVHRVHHSSFGRAMRAVQESEVAASAMGISLGRVKVLSFVIGAVLAGLAGALNAGFVTYVSPSTYSLELSVSMLAMVVVGGSRSPWGAVVGAFVLTFLPQVLRFTQNYYLLIYGLLLLFMVAFVPGGLWGLLRSAAVAGRGLIRGRADGEEDVL